MNGLSRDFVVKSLLGILDEAEHKKQWGSVTIQFQAGVYKLLKTEKTITEEKDDEISGSKTW